MSESKTYTELVDHIHPFLSTLDYSKTSVKLGATTVACVVSAALFFLTHFVSTLTCSLYRGFRLKEKVFWNLSLVRACFGVFGIVVGVWAIFWDTALEEDISRATTPTSHLALCITTGFFVFEVAALTLSDIYFHTFNRLLQLHHWISVIGFSIALLTEGAHQLACKGLIIEMSTPFSALCWILLKAGKERTLLWKANQFLLVHSFHLRNVAEVMMWCISYRHWDNVWNYMPTPLFVVLYGQLTLVTFLLTPYWTYKKSKQMFCPVDWNFESTHVTSDDVLANRNDVRFKRKGQNSTLKVD